MDGKWNSWQIEYGWCFAETISDEALSPHTIKSKMHLISCDKLEQWIALCVCVCHLQCIVGTFNQCVVLNDSTIHPVIYLRGFSFICQLSLSFSFSPHTNTVILSFSVILHVSINLPLFISLTFTHVHTHSEPFPLSLRYPPLIVLLPE